MAKCSLVPRLKSQNMKMHRRASEWDYDKHSSNIDIVHVSITSHIRTQPLHTYITWQSIPMVKSLSMIIKTNAEVYNGKCLKTCIHAYIYIYIYVHAENQSSITGESIAQSPVPGDFLTWLISTIENGIFYLVLLIIAALTVLYIKFGQSRGKDVYHIPLSSIIITTCMTQV